MTSVFRPLLHCILPAVLGVLMLAPSSALAQQCASFADRQINLADNLMSKDDYPGALRVLNVAGSNCDVESVRSKVASVMNAWYDDARSTSELSQVIRAMSQQEYLSSGERAKLDRKIRARINGFVASDFQSEDYRATYQTCQQFGSYTDETFTLNYRCGIAAENVQAYNGALERYQWLMDNWTGNSMTSQDEVLNRIQSLYLLTARFDEGFEISKQLARRTPEAETVLASLIAVRGKFLEPVARIGAAFLQQSTPSKGVEHVRSEMLRVKFPSFVESIFTIDASGEPTAAYYGEEAAVVPDADLVDRSVRPTSLIQAPGNAERAWLLASTGDGRLVVQYNRSTSPDENVILEGLLSSVDSDPQWQRLYDAEFTATFPATGSAVATFLGGTYLADASLDTYDAVFEAVPSLSYFCVQGRNEEIQGSHAFSRNEISYDDSVWDRTSKTPALYHHEVTRGGAAFREVVWPTYDGETWSGVVRIGISPR